jgi:hypothetical protein
MTVIPQGTWVEIEKVVLQPSERSPSLPEDTKKVPYILRVSGFLIQEAELEQQVKIRTIIGRELEGTLKVVNPHYSHSFGRLVSELLTIGTEAEE